MSITPVGGIRISNGNSATDNYGDVILYSGTSNVSIRIGHSNAPAAIQVTPSNDVFVAANLASEHMYARGFHIRMDTIETLTLPTTNDISSVNSLYAASNHTFLMGRIDGVSDWKLLSGGVGEFTVTYPATQSTFSSNVTFAGTRTKFNQSILVGTGSAGSNDGYPCIVASMSNNVSIYAYGDITALSDKRAKKDIVPIENALGRLLMMNGYTFSWTDETLGSGRSVGFLAQEVQPVLPEVVHENASGFLHVAYGNVVPLLAQAVKELESRDVTFSFDVTATTNGHSFEQDLPEPPSGFVWTRAIISNASTFGRGYASVISSPSPKVTGSCDVEGQYSVVAFCSRA